MGGGLREMTPDLSAGFQLPKQFVRVASIPSQRFDDTFDQRGLCVLLTDVAVLIPADLVCSIADGVTQSGTL